MLGWHSNNGGTGYIIIPDQFEIVADTRASNRSRRETITTPGVLIIGTPMLLGSDFKISFSRSLNSDLLLYATSVSEVILPGLQSGRVVALHDEGKCERI